jgi:hypothetical protein
MVARGRVAIETEATRLQVDLIGGALESDESQAFLARIPSPDALIPTLGMDDLKKMLTAVTTDEDRKAHPWRYNLRAVEQRSSGDPEVTA